MQWEVAKMGVYQSDYWQPSGWGMNRRETQGGTYHPYLPDYVSTYDLKLVPDTAAAISQGEAAILALNQQVRYLTNTEPLARLILRSEALASSRIEGLEVNAGKLLEHEALDELGVAHRTDSTEAAVMANVTAMNSAVLSMAESEKVTLSDICTINRMLLKGSRLENTGGTLRTEQNWIGGNNVNPVGAAYVPPRPEYVRALMSDLVEFCNSSSLPPLALAAVAHAQLETIHPFADGNGRTGRALVHIILRRSGLATSVVPPISLILATDKSRYINNLAAYRTDDATSPASADCNERRQDAVNNWIEYFSHACLLACNRAAAFEHRMLGIEEGWRSRLPIRKNSAADLLLSKLPGNPVVSVTSAARLTGRSGEAARLAIKTLVSAGILVQNAKNRKSGIYVAQDVLDAFTAYERALATPGGDTAIAKPVRATPQRVPREKR